MNKEEIENILKLLELDMLDNEQIEKLLVYIRNLQKEIEQYKDIDQKICNEELITKDKYQSILKENAKLQKENEGLKQDNKILCEIAYLGKRVQIPYTPIFTSTYDFISKDKIRNKIKELGETKGDLATYIAVTEKMKVLNELLEENE